MTAITQVRTQIASARSEAEALMNSYASLAKKKKKLDEKYKNDKLALDQELSKLEDQLHQFADNNPEEFDGKKSLNLEAGSIGWRLMPGRLNFTLDTDQKQFEQLIKAKYKDALDVKVNTATVIKLGKTLSKLREDLAAIGVTIEQDDKFFVTPKL